METLKIITNVILTVIIFVLTVVVIVDYIKHKDDETISTEDLKQLRKSHFHIKMKYLAILFSTICCGVFCNKLYSQNISDAVKDVVVSIEYDKVYDEFHHIAKIKDFCSSNYDKGYSVERYGSHKYYEEVYDEAYKEATRNIDSRKMGAFIYSFLTDKDKRKLGNQGWGILAFQLSKTEGLLKYSLTIRTDEGIKVGRVFTKDECRNIFNALDTSMFNSWPEDVDYLAGGIKFRLQDTN